MSSTLDRKQLCNRKGLLRTLIVTLSVAIGLTGCSAKNDQKVTSRSDATTQATSGEVFPKDDIAAQVQAMPHKTVKALVTKRLADGLIPPTNRWFSGLVFGDTPQPVFPLPLSFGLTESGFAFGQPTVKTTEKNIAGGFQPDIRVDTGAKSARVSSYDTLTVTIDSINPDGELLGRTTIAQGSPFVRYAAAASAAIQTGLTFAPSGDFWTARAGDVTYGLVVQDGSVSGAQIELEKGGSATWFVVPPDGSAETLAKLASNAVIGSSLSYQVQGDQVRTSLAYESAGGTAFAAMPHQQEALAVSANCGLGTYPSIYGNLKLCSGNDLSYSTPVTAPTGSLDLSKISDSQREQLRASVTEDVAATPAFPADTYFGGKALYRAAMLYQLAAQLNLDEPANQIKSKLVQELTKWTEPQGCTNRAAFCFVYDDQAKGVVGLTPSFGSDEFNDHHFHYGYFLYAAGVVAADDPGLTKRFAPVMNLLAADLGSTANNGAFPNRRTFDAYAGHSWASGTSPFADGNNQESSSEAVTAWTGLALWAKVSGNSALETEATWMLSTEAQAGLAYWTNFDDSQPVYSGYGHRIVPLNWGGKRDYATWFSPEPAAMLGILVIPMSPASTYLAGDPGRIEANVAEATGGKFDQKFGDYLLMYSALAGEKQREAALATAEKLDGKWIDDGNSRSYMLAWLMSTSTEG